MSNNKIYGIDLGTTNSLIADEMGVIGRSPIVKSIVSFREKSAGIQYESSEDAFRSFKVDMSLSDDGKLSVVASSLVLKEIVKNANVEVRDVVISVPAFFSDNQREATITAAKNAGLNPVRIVNEPTAAAIAYAKGKRLKSVVYDLGGGTFDISVVDTRNNIYDVIATDGLKIGGDDFDSAISKWIFDAFKIKVYHLDKMAHLKVKLLAEKMKIEMQNTNATITINGTAIDDRYKTMKAKFTEEDYVNIMKETFKSTVMKTKRVMSKAVQDSEIYTLLMVGGSTRCPYLRGWLEEELGIQAASLTYNPDYIVAEGAGILAHMIEVGEFDGKMSEVTKALGIGIINNRIERLISQNAKLPCEAIQFFTNPEEANAIEVELFQGDSSTQSSAEKIGTLRYEYPEMKGARMMNLAVTISVNIDGLIKVTAEDFPNPPREIVLKR